ncbi:MAG: RNA 2',3'-cyclic phosphodiesterase [Planctomycetales bacterium]|nr:RNA 2',3'-cyclic phosphodiesterase [Planctomycetales bacterium]
MRLFAAIDINPQVRGRIEQVQKQLARQLNLSGRDVKWVHPDQIHLTLKFLGEVRDTAVTQVCDAVTRTAGRFDGFEFQVRGAGVFGRPARVVWAGGAACAPLMELQAALENEFSRIGWEKENRPFAGHLTLCRVKNASAGRKLEDAIEAYRNELFGSVSVSQVVLYHSVLDSAGPQYSAVCTGKLK